MDGSGSEGQDMDAADATQLNGNLESQSDLDYAAAAAAAAAAVAQSDQGLPAAAAVPFSMNKVPTARKDELQRLLGQCLVVRCDPDGPYAAPVVTMAAEESNIYTLVEKHFKAQYLVGTEKFWRLVRTDLQVDTWRPRVQGTQLKALIGARLPENEQEFQSINRVINSLQDCLKPESSPDLFMQDLRITVSQIQAWWQNRIRKPDGTWKRYVPMGPGSQLSRKRSASFSLQPSLSLLGAGDTGQLLQNLLHLGAPVNGLLDASLAGTSGDVGAAAAVAAAAAAAAGIGDGVMQQQAVPQFPQLQVLQPSTSQPQQQQGHPQQQDSMPQGISSPLGPLAALVGNPSAPLTLDVGGHKFRTTLTTLLSVQGSLFWQLMHGQGPAGAMQRLPNGELFIDRNGDVFGRVLEYLRSCAHHQGTFDLPNDASELQALAREAAFYQLPGLLHAINAHSITPHPGTREFFDTLYIETGFKSMEREITEMEHNKMIMMRQLNHVLSARASEGYYVHDLQYGLKQRNDPVTGETQHNMYYHILLKKVTPLVPIPLLNRQQQDMDDDDEQEEESGAADEAEGAGGQREERDDEDTVSEPEQ